MTSPTPPDDVPPAPAGGGEAPAASRPRRSLRSLAPRRRRPTAEDARRAAEGAAPAMPPDPPPPVPVPGDETDALLAPPPPAARPGGLRRRRRRLVRRRQDAIYHLGGLAFELYRRDLLAEDVIRRRAARVEALDDTVRLIDARLEEAALARRERRAVPAPADEVVGTCTACRASFRAGARFCSNCGTALVPPEDDAVTQAIPAPAPPERP